MTTIESRLAELGLELPAVAPPVAAYVPAVFDGNYVWVSGQLPTVAGQLAETGHIGDGPDFITPERGAELARICALNALAAIKSVIGDLERIERIVKVTGFIACPPNFTNHPVVVNGASILIGDVLGDRGVHARSSVGMAALPLGAPVEIEMIVKVTAD